MKKPKFREIKMPDKNGAEQYPLVVTGGKFGQKLIDANRTGRIYGGRMGESVLDKIEARLPKALQSMKEIGEIDNSSSVLSIERNDLLRNLESMKRQVLEMENRVKAINEEHSKLTVKRDGIWKHIMDNLDFLAGGYNFRFFGFGIGVGCNRVPYAAVPKMIKKLRAALKETAERKAKR